MCLKIKSGPYIAKQDFYTLKLVEDVSMKGYVSYYKASKRSFGSLQISRITIRRSCSGNLYVEKALHSIYIPHEMWVSKCLELDSDESIILCKIPKGTNYYIGCHGDIASDQLIAIEPLVDGGDLLEVRRKDMSVFEAAQLAMKIAKSYGYSFTPSK